MEYKLISVIMGVYNCASTLEEAVNCIINQTYPKWELIMCDDASTDDTYTVAKKYAQMYPLTRFFYCETKRIMGLIIR